MAKVLIVDDSQLYRFKLRKLVEAKGHEALTANNGQEALAVARQEQPDIILMDIVMPGMSGYEAKRSLARDPATNHIPVIFVSSRSAESDKVWGMRLGAAGYVTKPVNSEQLDSAIDGIFAA
ncbi:MAG: response regulator [Xanthomonadales bacterium]|nr:response regulator [Xanthomonadales bacterium]